ncbi:hypothetical protein R6Q59_015153 [Mikania micrantha]
MDSVSDNPVIVLNIAEELPPMSQNETSLMSKFYRFPVIAAIMFLKCIWTKYFWPGMLGEEGLVPPGSNPDNPLVILNMNGEQLPAQTNNQTSFVTNVHQFLVRTTELLCRLWTHYFPRGTLGEEGIMIPGSAFNFVIIGLFSFTAIKSQGESRFPFHSNPQTITLAINSLIMYGLASEVENVISAARPGPNSVYVLIACLGKKLCLYVLMGAMVSLFIL